MSILVQRLRSYLRDHPIVSLNREEMKPLPPATSGQLAAAEVRLGFPIPSELRDIYLHVGNGGFGPLYGLIGIAPGFRDDLGHNVEDLYSGYHRSDPNDEHSNWPCGLLPICHLGCAMYACIPSTTQRAAERLIWFEPNIHDDDGAWTDSFRRTRHTLESWLTVWMDGADAWKELASGFEIMK